MRVVRDKTTHEMKLMWNVVSSLYDTPVVQPDVQLGENDEMVDLPSMSHDTVMELARMKAGGQPGRIFVHNASVEAELAIPPTPITDALVENREKSGVRPDAPITVDELRNAEKRANGQGFGNMGTQAR